MKKIVWSLLFLILLTAHLNACTSIIVTKGATQDKSVIITYSCDGEFLYHFRILPAQDHEPGTFYEIRNRDGEIITKIPQPAHTHRVVGLMNEHQLSIGETTTTGRKELRNPEGTLHYWTLMQLALQRAKTAREAIEVMTSLVEEYGYASTGEAFSIADPEEAWIMEMIGTGPGGKGAVWVARKVPDGYVCCHANLSRIGEFPLNDKKNCLYSDNVISFAKEKGYYDPDTGEPFRFNMAYCPPNPQDLRACAGRVWSILRRTAPSKNISPDYYRGVKGAESYPLWIKPDKKLSVKDVMNLMRDHYEGTDFDMRNGIAAGPFNLPYRWRGLSWQVDSVEYCWERPVSTQQTAFSFVSQSREHLPDEIGGVFWFGFDDTYFTCYTPLYCCIDKVPDSFTSGDMQEFSFDSAWWVFNFVSNLAYSKYSSMIEDIQAVQSELESYALTMQPHIEQTVVGLSKSDKNELIRKFLTDYSFNRAEEVVKRWKILGKDLLTKYNDGYVKDEKGRPQAKGYPEFWLRQVIEANPEKYKLPVW